MASNDKMIKTIAWTIGAAVFVVTSAFGIDAKYAKVSDLQTIQDQIDARFYQARLIYLSEEIEYLNDKNETGGLTEAERRKLDRMNRSMDILTSTWQDMADRFGRGY